MRALPALATLAALLVALLAAGAPAHGAEPAPLVEVHAWHWRVLAGEAQVREALAVSGPGEAVLLELPAGARGVQAFADGSAAPWEWAAPRLLRVEVSPLARLDARADILVLYVAPVGPGGVAVERALRHPVELLAVGAEMPEGWEASLDGQPLGTGERAGLAEGARLALRLAPPAGPSPLAVLGGLTLLVLVVAMARAVTARGRAVPEAQGVLDHLRELTGRLRVVVVAVAVLMLGIFTFALVPAELGGLRLAVPVPSLGENIAAQTFRLLAAQFVPPGVELVVVDPVSAALVQVEVALFLALLVATPLLAYEAGAFLMPALLPRERSLLLRAIPAATLLFAAGAAFAYVLMVPTMMGVLYSYAAGLGARSFLAVDHLVSFAIVVTLLFGIAFELPVIMALLARLGIASPRAMAAKWRHAVVGVFVLAAVITPDPSVVSQVLVAVPMLALYAVGLAAARAAAPPS